MIWVDYFIILTVLVSVVVGAVRGFTRETLSLMTWVLAIGLSWLFGDSLAARMQALISIPSVRIATAYGAIFLAVLALGAVVTHLMSGLIRRTPLSGPDRTLGAGFGLLRGGAIVTLLVFLVGMTPARHDDWWRESFFIFRFERAAGWLRAQMPEHWQQQVEQINPAAAATMTGS